MPLRNYQPFLQFLDFFFPNLLIPLLFSFWTFSFWQFNSIDKYIDRIHSVNDKEDIFDFIVVGAGSSGSVVANRLSENGEFKVLVLERGGEGPPISDFPSSSQILMNSIFDYKYFTTPQKNACFSSIKKKCSIPRGKGLGGSSQINFLIYTRGHKNDYDRWSKILNDSQWSFQELLPYFLKSENYLPSVNNENKNFHSKNGPLSLDYTRFHNKLTDYFIEAAKELGYPQTDINSPYSEGFDKIVHTIDNRGRRCSAFKAFLKPIRWNRPNLKIYKFSHVYKILLNNKNESYGVEYLRHGVIKRAFVKRELILSAGAIDTTKILMLSSIGPRKHLEDLQQRTLIDLPVGLNYHDHLGALFTPPIIIDEKLTLNFDRFNPIKSMKEFLINGNGEFATNGLTATGFIYSSEEAKRDGSYSPDLQFFLVPLSFIKQAGKAAEFVFHFEKGVLDDYISPLAELETFFIIPVLAKPKSRGNITLKDTNPESPPILNPNFLQNPEDIKVMIKGVKFIINLIENTTIFQSIGARIYSEPFAPCKHFTFKSDDYWSCQLRHLSFGLYHPTGTCAMGKVVDSELRVFGVKKLRVIDLSIMPELINANTNAAAIMIGEKGSDLILNSIYK